MADYWFDWGSDALDPDDRFLPADATIVAHSITVNPSEGLGDATLTSISDSRDTKTVRWRASGGIDGQGYPVDCVITTDDGQIFEQTKVLQVEERKS